MERKEIKVKDRNITTIIDDNLFIFKYSNSLNCFFLERKLDGEVIETLKSTIGFIKQINKDNDIYFYLTDLSDMKHTDGLPHVILNEYKYINHKEAPKLYLVNRYNVYSTLYDDICMSDNSFIINSNSYSGIIYSPKLLKDNKSRRFSKIYTAPFEYEDGKDYNKEYVIVTEIFGYDYNYSNIPLYYDEVTYGIDPDTLKIVTKIYSKRQNRFISLYTKEEATSMITLYEDFKYFSINVCNNENDYIGSMTLLHKVIKPLEEYIDFYKDDNKVENEYGSIKSSFVKRLVK